uniref:Protein S-acyltransferase n=1 Tax=Caenorhabditis japonica TaxID=281687 RepID=A0A8R1HMA9_CAEJA
MLYVFGLCFVFVWTGTDSNARNNVISPPYLCAIVLLALCAVLCVPVIGLTVFHLVLVARGRTTNEQVTGKFTSGYNPFTIGCWGNCKRTLCHSQIPPFKSYVVAFRKQRRAEQKMLAARQHAPLEPKNAETDEENEYVPDEREAVGEHIPLVKVIRNQRSASGAVSASDSQQKIAESQSMSMSSCDESSRILAGVDVAAKADGSTCNLFDLERGASSSPTAPTAAQTVIVNGSSSKPRGFTDAVRLADILARNQQVDQPV